MHKLPTLPSSRSTSIRLTKFVTLKRPLQLLGGSSIASPARVSPSRSDQYINTSSQVLRGIVSWLGYPQEVWTLAAHPGFNPIVLYSVTGLSQAFAW